MKIRRSILGGLLVVFFLFHQSPLVFAASYLDTRGHWAESYIAYLSGQGVIQGYGDGRFRPNGSISKVEFYSMVNKSAGLKKTYAVTFTDVDRGFWYYNEVAKAVKAGYIQPTMGRLNPNRAISRQEAARILGYMYNLRSSDGILSSFSDQAAIEARARKEVAALVEIGVIEGYGNGRFGPNKAISRGEASKIFSLLRQNYGKPPARSLLDSKIRFGGSNLHQ